MVKINHPELSTTGSIQSDSSASLTSTQTPDSNALSDILVLPEPKKGRGRRRGVNSKAICLTEVEFLKEMKVKQEKKRKQMS